MDVPGLRTDAAGLNPVTVKKKAYQKRLRAKI
jgi:hypothetical protein